MKKYNHLSIYCNWTTLTVGRMSQPWVYNFQQLVSISVAQHLQSKCKRWVIHKTFKRERKNNNYSHTCIFEVVLGSRKPFAVFQSSLNPLPAFTTNIWCNVCEEWASIRNKLIMSHIMLSLINCFIVLNHLRIVISINFLNAHNKVMCDLAKTHPILQIKKKI